MKKLILLSAVLFAFTACSSDDDNDNNKEEIEYYRVEIPYKQGEETNVSKSDSWSHENTAKWAYFSPKSGKKGQKSLYIYEENPTNAARYDTVKVIQSGVKTYYRIYKQAANPNK